MTANAKTRLLFYNKNNKIVVKLNDAVSAKKMKKQALKEVANRTDTYFAENNITVTKLHAAQTLLSGNIVTQTINEKEIEKWRGKTIRQRC